MIEVFIFLFAQFNSFLLIVEIFFLKPKLSSALISVCGVLATAWSIKLIAHDYLQHPSFRKIENTLLQRGQESESDSAQDFCRFVLATITCFMLNLRGLDLTSCLDLSCLSRFGMIRINSVVKILSIREEISWMKTVQ